MPYLGDYLGQLVSEIALARMQSDLETIRIAELYASHPLLRLMPVPRMRVPEVSLELPLLIRESEAPRTEESPRGGGVDARLLREQFERLLDDHLKASEVTLEASERRDLRSELDARLEGLRRPADTSVDVFPFADELTAVAATFVRRRSEAAGRPDEVLSDNAVTTLKHSARLEFLKLRSTPPRLSVLVTDTELRERASDENIVRIRVKVGEDALEWTTVESGGVERDRLVPE